MRRPALVAASLAVLALATVASATVVLRSTVEELTDLCHGAVLARVTERSVEFDRPNGRIWTNYRLRVEETWSGEPRAELTVSVPGGEADGLTQEFSGGASFREGERAAVFLWRRDDGRVLVLGEAQGAFVVRRDAESGEDEVCENDVEGLVLVDRAGKRVEGGRTRLALATLRTRVAEARRAREERERAAREAKERRLEELRARARRHAEIARGRPGAPPE